jgi:sigma-B regulation protein RsbU (phosphoserine phosphatase)
MIKTLFSIESIENKLSYPQKVLEYLNIKLFNQIGDNFVTGQYALIDLDKYFLEISNAGDNPLYLIRKNILQKIEVKGRAIGLFEDSTYITQKVKIEKDDILFFYTDGLTEAINDKEEVFKNKLEEILIKNSNKTSKEINQIILNELKIFTQKEHYDDDIALVTIKIK